MSLIFIFLSDYRSCTSSSIDSISFCSSSLVCTFFDLNEDSDLIDSFTYSTLDSTSSVGRIMATCFLRVAAPGLLSKLISDTFYVAFFLYISIPGYITVL